MWQNFKKNRVVKYLASLKLAVCVIVSFTILMVWGTFVESSYGADYAKWQVYLSPIFIAVEILLFLNILFAALVRLPFKKRLSGFYIIHLGLLTLLIGAAFTAIYGIDGSLRLLPKTPSNAVVIKEPTFYAFYNRDNLTNPAEFIATLPKVVKTYERKNKPFVEILDYDLYLDKFLPFATPKFSWKPHQDPTKRSRFLAMSLANAMFTQNAELSTLSLKEQSKKLGPLNLMLLNNMSSKCFKNILNGQSLAYLFENQNQCLSISKIDENKSNIDGAIIQQLKAKPFVKIAITDNKKQEHIFYPALSSLPIDKGINIDKDSQAFLLKTEDIKGPHVIFFKDNVIGFGKDNEWKFVPLEPNKEIHLPWMGFKLTVLRIIDNKYEHKDWFYNPPQGAESQRHFAAQVTLKHRFNQDDLQTFWIDDLGLKNITTKSGFNFDFMIGNKLHHLPYTIELDQFKMSTNPGTRDPASYESFVKVKSLLNQEDAHIYMNNPLKKGKFTFYQASYFPVEDSEEMGSVLSVNYDPGRATKYIGSVLLVLGSILHFTIRSITNKKNDLSTLNK